MEFAIENSPKIIIKIKIINKNKFVQYLFRNPLTDEIIEVTQRISEPHIYIDSEGCEYERVFTIPNACIDGKIDPFSRQSFLDKTKNKGSVGDLLDRSKELSEMRKSKNDGIDPVQTKFFDDWSKERKGRIHPKDPRK